MGQRSPLNQSLARGLEVLQAFNANHVEYGVRDLARKLGIDRSAIYRIVRTLADAGFLEQNHVSRRYRIGHKAFEVGQRYTSAGTVYDSAIGKLSAVAANEQLNIYLAERVDTDVLYLAAIESETAVFRVGAGTRGHLHATALGKVLLAGETDRALKKLLARLKPAQLTAATKTSRPQIMAEIRKVREAGHSIADEENMIGIWTVGAPIVDSTGRIVAAISGSVNKADASKSRRAKIIKVMLRTAAFVSTKLGAPPGSPFHQTREP
jgi:DNA-binding IclR family transcriptional regulator